MANNNRPLYKSTGVSKPSTSKAEETRNINNRLLYPSKGVSRPSVYMGSGAEFEPYSEFEKRRKENELQYQARLKAIELAKQNSSNSVSNQPTNNTNAGDDRTTALRQPQQNIQGNAILPTYSGQNIATNGANVNTDFKTETTTKNGWKGLRNWLKDGDQMVSQKQGLSNAENYIANLDDSHVKMLEEYAAAEDSENQNLFFYALTNIGQAGNPNSLQLSDAQKSRDAKEKIKAQFINDTGVSEEEFEKLAKSVSKIEHNKQYKTATEEAKNASVAENVITGVVSSAVAPYMSGYAAAQTLFEKPNSELGRDYNDFLYSANRMQNISREAVENKISDEDKLKEAKMLGYDVLTSGVQSASSALSGDLGLAGMALDAYISATEEAAERGLSERQGQLYSTTVGTIEYLTEKMPQKMLTDIIFDFAKKDAAKTAGKATIKSLIKEEMSEELYGKVGDLVADAIINADMSKVNIRKDYLVENEGLSESAALRQALFEEAKETGYSMLVAGLSVGVSAGGPTIINKGIDNYRTTKAGRNIATDEKLNQQILEDIPTEREGFVADEDYDQAQKTREAIIAAAEKAKAKKRISGKEARSLYKSVGKTYENIATAQRAKVQQEFEKVEPEAEETYKAPQKTQEEVINDIEFASNPYELATAIDALDEIDEETKELIEYKRDELKMYGNTDEELDNVITAKKAFEMGKQGQSLSEEQLKGIPQQERTKLLELNNQTYNKTVLEEHPDALSDTSSGKYFVPSEVKTDGQQVIVVDSEGNEHTEFSSPKISAAESAYNVVSKDANTGKNTDQNVFNATVQQASLATELAIKSVNATPTQIKSAVRSIFTVASTGSKTWNDFAKRYNFFFDVIDKAAAEKLYNQVREDARTSDRVKQKNTAGKRTSEEVVSKTLREALPEETVALLEDFGRKIGYNFVASTNKNARGDILPSKRQISIGMNNISELYAITSHEAIAEYLQAHGNEAEVLEIQDMMLEYLEDKMGVEAFNNLIDTYQAVYRTGSKSEVDQNKSRRAAANEMFADTVWTLFSSEEGLNDLIGWVSENNTASEQVSILQKIKDFFGKIFNAIQHYIESGSFNGAEKAALEMDAKQAKEFRDKIFKAMDNAIANAKASEGVQQGESAPRNSLMPKSQAKLKQDITSVMNGKYKKNYVDFGKTPKIYSDILGVKPLEMLMTKKHVYNCAVSKAKAIRDGKETGDSNINYHNLGADILSQIPKAMNTPAVIVKYNTNTEGRKATDFTVLVNLRDNNNKPITVGIEISEKPFYSSDYIEVNLIDTTYGRRIEKYLRKAAKEHRILYVNKTRSQELFGVGVQYPESLKDTSFFKDSLESYKELVNNKLNKKSIKAEKLEDIARHSFAGIGAETADMHQLNIASDMMDDGIDEETILASTGWFKGLDNKWKFEIPDNDLVIFKDGNAEFLYGNPDFKRYNELMDKIFFKGDVYTDEEFEELGELEEKVLLKTQDYGNLSDFIKHDKLFDAYPFLYGTYVDFVDFGDASIKGAADIKNNGIHLNEQFHKSVSGSYSSDAMKSVLLHEIQHLIQQYEDFANGSSPTWWNDIKEERIEADEKNLAAAKEYLDRAIADARERGLPTSVEDYIFELSEQLDSNELTPEEYRKEIAKFKKSKVYHYSDMVRKLERHLRRLRNDSNELLYWNTAGEIEARDVQNRMSLTEQERREKLPKNYDSDVVYTDGSTAQRRYSIKVDTEGRSLSEGQQEYFKDSNVVDDNGNLMVVYHGSPNEFTEFKHEFIGTTGAAEGKGFYFTNNKSMAEGYSREDRGQILKGYLNITKPLSLEEITLTKSELKKFLMAVDPTGDEILSDYDSMGGEGYPSKAWYNRALNDTINAMMQFNENDADIAAEIFNMLDKDGLLQFKNILGYDGFIARDKYPDAEVYVAFDSNQFKNTDNLNPTDNPDIRKSIKVDDQGREIAPKMAEYLKDNADVFFDENGAVKNYYHGTRYAGFTQFSLSMMDDKQSIFLTDNKGTANTYAGNHELFEPDKEWTYNQLENAISYMTGGDWEVEQDGDTITITEYGFGDEEDKETQFDSILAAQTYFIDNFLNKIDLKSDENAAIYNLYVKSSNPLVIDANGDNWDQIIPKKYFRHFIDVNITKTDEQYSAEWADERGVYYNHTFDSKEKLEELLAKLPEDVPQEGLYFENLYIDENRDIIPSNTRTMAKYAKENGYDSLVVNNVVDTGIFGNNEEKLTPSQVVVVFNPSQAKSVFNENPTADDKDIRKSIKVDWDKNDITIPARTYEASNFFDMSDEEMEAAEKEDIKIKAYWANIIHSKDFAGLMFSWEEARNNGKTTTEQRYLTKSTREYDWQYSYGRDNEPHGHYNYYEKNDDVTIYGNPWGDDMASLYQELLNDTPMEGIKVHVLREGIADDARQSIKVYGEASPYADSINETKTISALIGSMNSALSKVDAFSIPNDELIRIERLINNKYKVEGLEEGEIAANVAYAFAHMQNDKLDTDYEAIMNYLLNIGDEVIKHSNLKDPDSEAMYNEVRTKLQSHKIKLTDEDRAEISNAFGGSWKAAFGALQKAGIKLDNTNGVSIDSIFSEIKQEVLEAAGVDISYGDKPSEQILALVDTMTALEPTAYLWDGANEMDKALTVVSDIVQLYYQVATEQLEKDIVKGTAKGKESVKKAVEKETAKLRSQWNKYKSDKTEEFNKLVAEKNRIIQQQQQEIKRQNEQMKTWEKDLADKDKQLAKRTTLTDKEIKATARLQAKQAVQSYKDRQERAKQIENIKKTGIRLIKWLTNPTDAQHVPAFLQKPLGEFLAAIDFLPNNPKADSKSTLSWHQRMNALREELVRIKNAEEDGSDQVRAYFANNIVAKELISMMDDFLGKEEWDEFTQSYILTKRAASKVSNLDAKDLAMLNKIMSALSASINNLNKTYANDQFKEVSKLAKESVKEVDSLPSRKDMQKMVGKIFNFLNFDELEPITYFEGLGSGAKSVFDELREGFNLKTKHVRESDEYMAAAKAELGISDKELSTWKNQLHKFDLVEGTVMLNTTQIMSLYEILKRKQGRPHIAVGGIKSADFEYKDGKIMKKHHQAKAVHIMSSEAQAIIDTLTDEQKALADKMQQYMASECASWGNRVTEKMWGYKKYEEKDYFPLKTDSHSRATTASSDNNVSYYTIKNASFTKPITPMANNAVVLEDIFDVFTNHVVQMANYDAYVMPIADAMRWFNYSERVINAIEPDELNEQGARMDYIGNMQESIDRVYGDAGLQYFRQFIKDINGDYAGKGGKSEILSSLMSMYKAQAVGANMRVVIQQPTAVVRAADVIETKYLLEAMVSLPKAMEYAKKAQANSEIAYWKAQGYYETYLGQSFKEIITGDTTLKDRMNDLSGKLAGLADDLSWGIMYHAAELKVMQTQPQLQPGTKAFDKAATKIFEDIVDHTQVVDTIFHKSQWMRSQELGHKMTSAFMAEPTKTYNMLYRAFRNQKLYKNKESFGELRKVALIFLFEQMLNAVVTAAWDSLRDDEKEDYINGLKTSFTENAIDNLILLNLIPIAKDIVSFFNGYDATSYVYDGLETLVSTINADKKFIANMITGEKQSKTPYGIGYQNAKAISQITGVPFANVSRDVVSIYNALNNIWGGEDIVKTTDTRTKQKKMKAQQLFHDGFQNNPTGAMNNVHEESIKNGKSESDAWGDVRDCLKIEYLSQMNSKEADIDQIKKNFKKYLSQTMYDNGTRAMTEKEIENKLDSWDKELNN